MKSIRKNQPKRSAPVREQWGIPMEVDAPDAEARQHRGLIRKTAGAIGVAAAAVSIVYGVGLMTKGDNMRDFNDLSAFTSADHQADRCKIQDAFDAQVKMNEHFDAKGGVTQADADLMGPVVGLEPSEVKSLIETDLYAMDYDCDVAVASSQEATIGLVVAVAGGAALAGGALGAGLAYRRRA